MPRKKHLFRLLFVLVLLLGLALVACGDDDGDKEEKPTATVEPTVEPTDGTDRRTD